MGMKPNETIRFQCGDGQAVFDLCVDPVWAAEVATDLGVDTIETAEPTCCPFCGAGGLKAIHDPPARN
jgi:hypothetical protein